ncbi:DUF2130 domain-containing protein [bacterium]|nr:DUF2130 domain-containing protein [bacterium]
MANLIKCPNCGQEIDIESLISESTKDEIEKQLLAQKKQFEKELEKFKADSDALKEKLEKEREVAVQEALKNQKQEIERKVKEKALEEQKEAFEELEKELKEKSEQLKEMNRLKAEKSRLEREKEELKEKISADAEREFSLKLAEEKQKLQKNAEEKYELTIAELKKQLEDQKNLTEEMKKRQEQGSMQLQGEVQELAIEDYLRSSFIYDAVEEVGKGDYGADSLQTVNTPTRQKCGKIYYESKRTKTFNEDWIRKFKSDIQEKGADIGVLVTATYPKDMTRMGLKDGIYICSYEEFKALSFVLRETIIKISIAKGAQVNRKEKSELLYDYLTSTEFHFQIEAILNSFVALKSELDSEKRAMNRIWKKREKEIENVIFSMTNMYGSLQGIAGSSMKAIKVTELNLLEVHDDEE